MMRPLNRHVEGETVYSFGKVESRLGDGKYKVTFREKDIIIATRGWLDTGTWIRMYGTFKSGVLRTTFVGDLGSVDINLLERAIEYTRERL
ncbi:hypothetical protein EHEL_081405 [Encephalitozoon hellem ATCC 50504]|uniref:Telomere length regulation protein TEN1 n=1 Tax=Encephalitozoon hellem TaxID=27973 RepID=A0A9Q9CDA0_ENCHE|nr:uncharacterized protein EHEL_081405 [Encephalitozoon hellem ATCC 50504]AHL28962.1 hypothetical protein EHEL_081405 [Encephalitozoon hellem ATCC 50504]UTX43819.1 telomere length regulation protein TEN1 [Encephalitozoon hellem]